jgi:hypothetical protein
MKVLFNTTEPGPERAVRLLAEHREGGQRSFHHYLTSESS